MDPEKRAAARRERDRRKNLRRRGFVVESDGVTDVEIFERDGWICRLCGHPTDRTAHHSARLATTVDHIVALSQGGSDLHTNKQTAHRSCNSSKGGINKTIRIAGGRKPKEPDVSEIEKKARADIEALMTAHPMGETLAEQAFVMARTLDQGVPVRDQAPLNRELRETLAELAGMGVPDSDDFDAEISTPVQPPLRDSENE